MAILAGLFASLFGRLFSRWWWYHSSPADIPPGGWVHIRTDGERMWVEVEQN